MKTVPTFSACSSPGAVGHGRQDMYLHAVMPRDSTGITINEKQLAHSCVPLSDVHPPDPHKLNKHDDGPYKQETGSNQNDQLT